MGILIDSANGTYQTTDDSVNTDALSYQFPMTNSSALVKASCLAMDSSQNTMSMQLQFVVKRQNGACSISGAVSTVSAQSGDLSMVLCDMTAGVSGSSIILNIQGLLLTTVNWALRLEIFGATNG